MVERILISMVAIGCLLGTSCRSEQEPMELDPQADIGSRSTPIQSPPDQVESEDSGAYSAMEIQEVSMREAYDLDTDQLTYQFTFRDIVKKGPIRFDDGKARLEFKGLPPNLRGEVHFTIFEAGTPKLSALQKDVTLVPGNNDLRLHLKPVAEGQTNINIIIEIGGNQPQPNNQVPYQRVKAIIDQSCVSCHGISGGLNLSTFPYTSSRLGSQTEIVSRIIDVVTGRSAPLMPPAPLPRLTDEEVNLIRTWAMGGFQK